MICFLLFPCWSLSILLAAVRLHPPESSVLIVPLHSSPSSTTPSPSSPLLSPLPPLQPTTLGATRYRERFLKTDRLPRHYSSTAGNLGFSSILGAPISRLEPNSSAIPRSIAATAPAFPIIQKFTRTRSPIYYPVRPIISLAIFFFRSLPDLPAELPHRDLTPRFTSSWPQVRTLLYSFISLRSYRVAVAPQALPDSLGPAWSVRSPLAWRSDTSVHQVTVVFAPSILITSLLVHPFISGKLKHLLLRQSNI